LNHFDLQDTATLSITIKNYTAEDYYTIALDYYSI